MSLDSDSPERSGLACRKPWDWWNRRRHLAQPVQEVFLKDGEAELRLRVRGTVFQAEGRASTKTLR